jgi:hypothetical protein
MDPGTAILISTAIATAAKGAGDYISGQKQGDIGKRRAKQTKRDTYADLLNEAMQRSAELRAHELASRQKLGKRQVGNFQDTSDIVRGALSI